MDWGRRRPGGGFRRLYLYMSTILAALIKRLLQILTPTLVGTPTPRKREKSNFEKEVILQNSRRLNILFSLVGSRPCSKTFLIA